MQRIAPPKTECYLPLFEWAKRHRAKPFPAITRWQIDRNLLVSRIEVNHG